MNHPSRLHKNNSAEDPRASELPLRAWGGCLCGHGFTRLVVACTVFLSSPYDSFPAEWGLVAGDHGALAFAVVIIVVEEDPVLRFLQSMGQGLFENRAL